MKNPFLPLIFSGMICCLFAAGCASAPREYSKIEREMMDSLRRPDSEKLARALAAKADPDLTDPDGTPMLMRAAVLRKYDACEMLLKAGADPNLADADGNVPMHAAAASKSPDIIELLMKYKASPDVADNLGRTPLMEAARLGRLENVRILLSRGANPSALDKRKYSLGTYAALARENGPELIRLFREKGYRVADPSVPLENHPLLAALDAKHTQTAHYLLGLAVGKKIDTPEKTVLGLAAMRLAILNDDRKSVSDLVALELPLNTDIALAFKAVRLVNMDGVYKFAVRNHAVETTFSPLIWAAIYGRSEIAAYLVSKGADPLRISDEGKNAYDYANDSATADAIRGAFEKKR